MLERNSGRYVLRGRKSTAGSEGGPRVGPRISFDVGEGRKETSNATDPDPRRGPHDRRDAGIGRGRGPRRASDDERSERKHGGYVRENGAPNGAHYNLNLIGVPKDKTADMTNNDGHRIFVQLTGGEDATSLKGKLFSEITRVNKIFLQPAPAGESFQVLDANATDANGALFQLPIDVSTKWTVWARALGKPGGKSLTTTCATVTVLDATGLPVQEVICSVATLTMQRTKNAKFMNVSSSLLFVTIAVDPAVDTALAGCLGITTTSTVSVPLFNGCLQNYFWNYQNLGLKLLQLRFYPAAG